MPVTTVKPTEHDWPEDWIHENGNYMRNCIHCATRFFGHKRRVTCKQCAQRREG